jgi:hypothetical protein
MLRTVLLVTVPWTAVSLLFCLAWSRPYSQWPISADDLAKLVRRLGN